MEWTRRIDPWNGLMEWTHGMDSWNGLVTILKKLLLTKYLIPEMHKIPETAYLAGFYKCQGNR